MSPFLISAVNAFSYWVHRITSGFVDARFPWRKSIRRLCMISRLIPKVCILSLVLSTWN